MNTEHHSPSGSIEHYLYRDIDSYAEALRGWDFHIAQLEPGTCLFEQSILSMGDYHLMFNTHSLSTLNCGTQAGAGIGFGIPLVDQPVIYLEHHTDRPAVCCVPRGESVQVITPAGFEGVTLFIGSEQQHGLLDKHFESPVCCPPRYGNSIYYPCPEQLKHLQQLLIGIRNRIRGKEQLDAELDQELRNCLEFQIIPLLYQIMANGSDRLVQWRPDSFHRALKLISDNLDNPPSVAELSKAVGISPRALQYLFKNYLQLSPKQFINLCRLNAARQQLRQSDYQRGRVADIANQLGYWHMGGFAQDFKRLFQISPTELLQLERDTESS